MEKHIKLFGEFMTEGKKETAEEKETIKKKTLDFVESNGSATHKEILVYMLGLKGETYTKDKRGYYSSYFSGQSSFLSDYDASIDDLYQRDTNSHGLLMRPTKKDKRYLEKKGKVYVVKYAK